MDPDILNYEVIVESALRGVVRTALEQVAALGMPGEHSLYIAFRTNDPGVDIPESLRNEYPGEMTIVVEHQFWDLLVGEDSFEITLSFNQRKERMVIPYAAMVSFADPSVPFGLKFEFGEADEAVTENTAEIRSEGNPSPEPHQSEQTEAEPESDDEDEEEDRGEIVSLDAFRKKR
jgi:hypothetical protein